MSLRDIEQSLKSALLSRKPEDYTLALEKLQSFVEQRPADAFQVESLLHKLYDSNSSLSPIELFVEAVYTLHEHLSTESITKTWWHLVLRPALQRQHLTRIQTRHAVELVTIGLREGDQGFRRTLLQLFVLGIPSPNSAEDAIEATILSDEERSQVARWKDNLVEILNEDANTHPKQFFEEMNREFAHPENRLPLSILLSQLAVKEDFAIVEFGNSPLSMTLLFSLFIDNSATVFTLQLTALTALLPLFAVKAPERLKEILPELLTILARAACWQARGMESDDRTDILHHNLQLLDEYNWKRLESSFDSAASNCPDATRYFTFLYGIYPCNCIAFLRDPIQYLIEKQCRSPFTVGWEDVLDEDEISSRCDILLRNHVIHPAIIKQTAEQELEASTKWKKDVNELVRACSLLDIRNAVGSYEASDKTPSRFSYDARMEGGEIFEQTDGTATPVLDHPRIPERRHPTVSIRQLTEIHMLLRSGLPVDIVHDFVDLPSTPRMNASSSHHIPTYEVAATTLSSTLDRPYSREEAKDDAISALQRDLLMMMNELNFEMYLRRHYLAQIGLLQKKSVQARGSEIERQRMRDQIKRNEQEIERHKQEKREMQTQIDRYRQGGDNFSVNMRQQIHRMRQEKAAWLAEAQELRARDAENKGVLAAQKERLDATETQIFELVNEKKANEVKILLVQDYERQIELMRSAEKIWREDHKKLKWQDDAIQQMRSRMYNLQAIIDSEQHVNAQLSEGNRYMEAQVQQLEIELSQLRRPNATSQNPKALQWSKEAQQTLQARINALEQENSKIRSNNSQLEKQLLQEQTKRESLQIREHYRERSKNREQGASAENADTVQDAQTSAES
ncbi:hypothetical protein FS842_008637 [Serendipita sp. 407]|nr:hypothetical protein FS842_008637 [Serendipita sp. 407]